MDAPDHVGTDWFVGDLDDPWIAAIADALPPRCERQACAGSLPASWFQSPEGPRTLVLHRPRLTDQDAECLARFRASRKPAPRIVLCFGPHVRQVDLEKWSSLVDALVPEATARDTIARHLFPEGERVRPSGFRPRVRVVSGHFELRQALAEMVAGAGYPVESSRAWSEEAAAGLAVWDVPVLEPDWPRTLARQARLGSVVALLGFPDRAVVALARSKGASACLELPVELADLVGVLDRLSALRAESAHVVPPSPASRRMAEPGAGPYNVRASLRNDAANSDPERHREGRGDTAPSA